MIYHVFSIRDMKTGFLQPTLEVNPEAAVRNFEHAVLRNDDSLFFSHPEDYALYRIGTYDMDAGLLTPEIPVVELVTASQIISAAQLRAAQRSANDGK